MTHNEAAAAGTTGPAADSPATPGAGAAAGSGTGAPQGSAQGTAHSGRSALRRLELLDAADRVVMRDGPDASMNTIAAEAGITKPILYRHFGDKDGLYRALAERHTEELALAIRAAVDPGPGGARTPRGRVQATIDTYLAHIEANPQVYRFLLHRAGAESADVHGHVTAYQRRVGEELARSFDPLGATGVLARAWAHGIVGMVQACGDWWLDEHPCERAELTVYLTELLWGALPTALAAAADAVEAAEAARPGRGPRPEGTDAADGTGGDAQG
ncbi:TetR family transcriptional regulator [Yinghuangia soli]|uniref:TetR/AcrR family transcriptional regulator n=1 Tax=Yinghuangia soli TaxID=2908204 RepID=A0AA41Q5E3_9ACTN|nr:TetR family transcriptional regulator [Yinghuangia soli]MCF2530709.1 TetR/AcrR family transcriptional regulator [Yinghuangia soli]